MQENRREDEECRETACLVPVIGARLITRLHPADGGYALTVTMVRGDRRTAETVILPTAPLAHSLRSLVLRHTVTPLSLPAVYDDFMAAALSLLPE